jgi:hypothetical protein
MNVLAADLDVAAATFDSAAGKDLTALNQELSKRKLSPIAKGPAAPDAGR